MGTGIIANTRQDALGTDFLLLPLFTPNGGLFNLLLMNHFLLLRTSIHLFLTCLLLILATHAAFVKNRLFRALKFVFIYEKVL